MDDRTQTPPLEALPKPDVCATCEGRGRVWVFDWPCPTCGGSGTRFGPAAEGGPPPERDRP